MSYVLEINDEDVSRNSAGGKAASLNKLTETGVNVPPGFIVTTRAFTEFISEIGFENLDNLMSESDDIEETCSEVRKQILDRKVPEEMRDSILQSYEEKFTKYDDARVAVRSSATSEDMEDASFAGQQDTFLNVTKDSLVEKIRECWASLFTERACIYRDRHNISHEDSDMAVVVQLMVDAESSGVFFTRHPSTGDDVVVIESSWGLGEAVVSGEVTPDKYVLDGANGTVEDVQVSEKRKRLVWNGNETVMEDVPEGKKTEQVLTEEHINQLYEASRRISEQYNEPQDVEWAIRDDNLYILQSRPITSITEDAGREDKELVQGLGASPGEVSGEVKIINKIDETDRITSGDVIVTELTTPDMVPAMERASAVVTDEGGMTSHAAIVSRELGVPSVVGTSDATSVLEEGDKVTVDGERGAVIRGQSNGRNEQDDKPGIEQLRPDTPVTPMTGTRVKVNVSLPQAAERAAATGADGVGLLRLEHLILSLGETPEHYISEKGKQAFIDELVKGIQRVAEEFYARPIRVRTLDAPTDEFTNLDGGEDEPEEDNPMLGYRGVRRSLEDDKSFRLQLEAIKRLHDIGYDNVEVMFPLINDADDVREILEVMESIGLDKDDVRWGVMVETPSSALQIEQIAAQNPDFVSFGTNDLTQYTLAVDRNNERVANRFDALHPSVLQLIRNVIEVCRNKDIDTSICGEAASNREMINELVGFGVTSLSVNIDAVRDTQHEVKRVEQRMVLDSVLDEE